MLGIDDVHAAAHRLGTLARRTPTLRSHTLEAWTGARLWLKAECFQRTGSFKLRGAGNLLASLDPARRAPGVVAASSGNHAQAVAFAAGHYGVPATVLMPHDAPELKVAATRGYGAEIVTYDRYQEDRDELLADLAAERGRVLVPAFDHPLVMAGQGTVALELLADATLDLLLVPVGGGGLIAGCATVAAAQAAAPRVVGVEPEAGDDVRRSLRAGQRVRIPVPRTIADGQQLSQPGALTFPVVQERVDDVVVVSDEDILEAMVVAFERLKVTLEPSGACALAALLAGRVDAAGLRVGLVCSGGNIGAGEFARLLADRGSLSRSQRRASASERSDQDADLTL